MEDEMDIEYIQNAFNGTGKCYVLNSFNQPALRIQQRSKRGVSSVYILILGYIIHVYKESDLLVFQ
jgi:hypothetical protein